MPRWIWKRLVLLEDSALVYRLQRTPERFAFYVDVGDLPPQEALAYVRKVQQGFKKKKYINPTTGKLELKFNPIAPDEDFWVPTRKGQDGTRIDNLGAPQWQHMDDIEYFRDKMFSAIKEVGDNPFAYVLVVVILFSSILLFLLGKLAAGRQGYAMTSKATRGAQEQTLPGWRAWAATILFAGIAGVALIPHVSVIPMSLSHTWYATILPKEWTLEHYRSALGHAMTVPSIANSLRYSTLATFADLIIGLSAAWIIVRTRIRGRALLDALVMAPLAVPGLVLAFGYMAMSQPGEFFSFLDPTEDPTILLVIAYSVRRLPYVVRALIAGLQQTGVALEEAARNLGAGPLRTLRRITLPLIGANVLAGAVLAFCFAMLEVSDSLILAQKQAHFPITKAIYELFQLLGEGRYLAAALGVWSMVFLALGLLLAGRLLGKKMGAMFRV